MSDAMNVPGLQAATSALSTQVGGSHYKNYRIQPIEFCVKNGWDFASSLALKYIVRHQDKAGAIDLRKAEHCGQLRRDLLPSYDWSFFLAIRELFKPKKSSSAYAYTMEEFINENDLQDMPEATTLLALDRWVRGFDSNGDGYFSALKQLVRERYPDQSTG